MAVVDTRATVLGTALSLLLFPSTGAADAKTAVVACRNEPDPDSRLRCFDQASLELVDEMQAEKAREEDFGRAATAQSAREAPGVAASNAIRSPVVRIDYEQGKPRFALQNGQVWQSSQARKLTSAGDGQDSVRIDKTPVGYLLHFNGSFFALPVVRIQ